MVGTSCLAPAPGPIRPRSPNAKGREKSRPNLAIQMSHRGRFVKVFPTNRRLAGALHALAGRGVVAAGAVLARRELLRRLHVLFLLDLAGRIGRGAGRGRAGGYALAMATHVLRAGRGRRARAERERAE